MAEKESNFQGVNYYVIIPAQVLHDNRLTPLARLIYGELSALANIHGFAWISNGKLAEKYGVSISTIVKTLGMLKENGYIRTEVYYKENSREVVRREIFIEGIVKNYTPPVEKITRGYSKKLPEGIVKNYRENNTVNNTSNISTTTTKSEENNFQKVSRLYQENFGVLSPIIADQLKYDLDDYGTDLVIEAMKRSALGQKNYRHAQGILKSWERTGIKTLADADAELVKFENQRQLKRSQKPTKGSPTADDYSASWGTRR